MPPVEISDVVVDLMDGKMLLNLLEVLLNTSLVNIPIIDILNIKSGTHYHILHYIYYTF